jgi:hypothetical protein
MWRVALWGVFHAILLTFGLLLRHIHMRGSHPWIEDPTAAALPTSLTGDIEKWQERMRRTLLASSTTNAMGERRTYFSRKLMENQPDPEGDPEKQE